MSDNFDLKKYLIENKATTNSRMLSENETPQVKTLEDLGTLIDKMQEDEEGLDQGLKPSELIDYTAVSKAASKIGVHLDIKKLKSLAKANDEGFMYSGIEMLERVKDGMTEMKKKHSKMMKEATGTVYEYTFSLSRGVSYDGVKEITAQKMASDIKKYYAEQGPEGSDMMQIYATTNTETGSPAVAVELEDSILLYSMTQLSKEVATKTAKKATSGKTIEPGEAEQHLNKMTENEKKHSKMMKENAGNFFTDFKSEFANYIQDYIEGGADEEVNVVDTNTGIDKWYQYPKTSVLVNHAVKSLQAAGVDSIEKLYAKNNLEYAGESLDEFFQNLEVNETYRGADFTLIPGVNFSFAEEV